MQNIALEQKIVNFSKLTDQDCAYLLQTHFLEALELEDPTYLEWEVLAKFIDVDYTLREPLRKLFNFSLKRNTQKIADVPINAWLQRYSDKYARIPREPDTFIRYATSNPEIQQLNEKDQIRLMRIFRLYDYFLIEPITSMDDTAAENIMRYPMYLSESLKEISAAMSSAQMEAMPSLGTASEKLTVKEALRKFPKLGEQAVTAGAIKLKQFDQPVRPSVRNWLYDYTSQLGQTGHSSMDRTSYLFRSDNAKNLSSPEREKLAIILKSFDENTPLPIDGTRQEIVFESFVKKEAAPPRYSPAPSRPSTSLNFIHHVERSAAPPAPAQRPFSIEPQKKSSPVQKQENSFVRPYPYPQPKPKSAPPIPPKKETSPPIPKQPPDELKYTNPYPKPGTHEMQFEKDNDNISNVRFSEGTPKNSFTPISQVSARKMPTGGSTSSPVIPVRPITPVKKPAPVPSSLAQPVAYKYTPPNRNIIQPHYGGETRREKPEPRIDGNIVDLKGDQ